MQGFIPVALAILIAAVLPFDVFPEVMARAFHEGGWGMRLILFALIVSAWLTVDRTRVLWRATCDARGFLAEIKALLGRGDVVGAIAFCEKTDRPLSRIVGAGLRRHAEGEKAVLQGMDVRAFSELPQIEARTGYLALMGNVATLMGLFGTIVGLIKSFGGVAEEEATEKATLLAAGISEAMNCTAFGLFTGIGALFAFSVLNGRTQGLLDDIHHASQAVFRAWKKSVGLSPKTTPASEPVTARPIAKPRSHLLSHIGLSRAGAHGGGRKSTFASLLLTPLIDMFIVLVIFLLMSFSATGEIINISRDLNLPWARNVEELKRVPVIAVAHPPGTEGYVTLEGSEVATAQELKESTSSDWRIARLTAQLEVDRDNWKRTNPGKDFLGELIIQSDENVDFSILKRIVYSAGVAGYGRLMFAVIEREGRGEVAP